MLQSLNPMHGGTITIRGNKKGMIDGVGMIGIPPYPFINNVLIVDGLKHNLMSISQLCDSEYGVSFNKGKCIVKNCDDSLFFITKRQENLYKIKLNELYAINSGCGTHYRASAERPLAAMSTLVVEKSKGGGCDYNRDGAITVYFDVLQL